jgi:hypothetical protein
MEKVLKEVYEDRTLYLFPGFPATSVLWYYLSVIILEG